MTASSLRNNLLLLFIAPLVWGRDVPDPYRWLEDGSSPKVEAWVQRQDEQASAYLANLPKDKALESRLHALYYVDSVSLPKQAGERLFYKRVLANQEQPVFDWRLDSNTGPEHLWLDPSQFPKQEQWTVGDWVPSPDGHFVAYAVHSKGADKAILRIRDIHSGTEDTKDVIAGANFADVAWAEDSRGFYYLRLPSDAAIPASELVAHADVRFHSLGEDSSKDTLIYPPTQDASEYLTPHVSIDGRWLFIVAARGWTSSEIFYTTRDGRSPHFQTLFASTCAVADVSAWKDYFYLHTNRLAPHGKILRKRPQDENWETLVPERPNVTIETMHVVGGFLALQVLRDAANEVEIYDLTGHHKWVVPLPARGKVWDVSGRPDQDSLYIEYESVFVPPRIYQVRLAKRKLEIWEQTKIPMNPELFKTELVWYTSKDGTPISMMIFAPKTLKHDGHAPVILEGYGGFNTPILPHFSQEALAWLERGGVYAVPHLRGGGEYGEAWHQAGMLTRKQNTFDDFIAAATYLIKEGYTSSDRLAIQGASNGGLLVAAAMTQRPDLFRAVICKNPLTDMIRYPLFGEGKAWIPEYGNPDNPEDFNSLLAYSPYHHVKSGMAYPALFMTAGEHDDRVDPMHARKFVAALEDANASGRPILFKLLRDSGHSNSDRLAAQVEETKERLIFLKSELSL